MPADDLNYGPTLDRRTLLRTAAALGVSLPAADLLLRGSAARAAVTASAALKKGGTLLFARNFEPQTLDPMGVSDNGSIFARVQIWDTLVEARPNTTSPVSPTSKTK